MSRSGAVREFTGRIEAGMGGGAFVAIPFDVEQVYGRKRVAVRAMIDGEPYRGTIMRMGTDGHIIGVLKAIREKIGKSIGDDVRITIQEDDEPRVVDVPADLRRALDASPAAATFFDRLSYTHQREYVQWVAEAKRAQTRVSRIERTVQMLQQGRRTR